ncbi:hypothetical protein CR513_46294, partial [Mucuna pruriens]
MVVALCYVNKKRQVIVLHGQRHDGASNMQGEFNGLKIANLSNDVGASCNHRDILKESQITKVREALQKGDISSGRGLNQEATTEKVEDTRWSSHYGTLLSLVSPFSSMIDVLEIIEEDGISFEQKVEACALLNSMQSFEFVFILHLMKNILRITHELCQALQRFHQDIINVMKLVTVSKQIQVMRDDIWYSLLNDMSLFCVKHNVVVPNMNDTFQTQGRSRRKMEKVSNLFHFQVELFYQVANQQLQKLNNHFTKMNFELLPFIFSLIELLALDSQLENYFIYICSDSAFSELGGISDLSTKLVETRKHVVYPLMYLLLELALILHVEIVSIARTFSTMNFIKNWMRNCIRD